MATSAATATPSMTSFSNNLATGGGGNQNEPTSLLHRQSALYRPHSNLFMTSIFDPQAAPNDLIKPNKPRVPRTYFSG